MSSGASRPVRRILLAHGTREHRVRYAASVEGALALLEQIEAA